MPEKKRSSAARRVERPSAGPHAPAAGASNSVPRSKDPSQPLDGPGQLAAFEAAIKLFHARNLKEARDLFLRAAEGPESGMAERARLHAAMCGQRLGQAVQVPRTAEDHYTYGVALINARDAAGAREHLEIALRLAPGLDHIHYALGLAQALAGDLAAAHENIKRAIELEPRNRIIARQDADLAPLAGRPPFDALLRPEKKAW